jgi:hypothetical protein
LPLSDGDEGWVDLDGGHAQGVNYAEDELRRDVPRPQVDDSNKGGASEDGSATEAEVMGYDDAALRRRPFKNLSIRSTNQMFFGGRVNIAAATSEAFDNVWTDVLVHEKGKIERVHAVIRNSQVCSPFSASAAY